MAEDSDQINWHVDMEVNLFHAMRGHKPVGVNRFFQMVFIHDKLNSSLQKNVSSEQIWKQLKKMYDLQALNESEIIPFPNKDVDFTLPDVEFGDLMDKEFPRMPKTGPSQTAVGSKQDSLISTPKTKGAQSGNSVPSGSNTPDISPKRKRTRNTQSTPTSANSTPDAPPTKRRR